MSSSPTDKDELIQRFINGELTVTELQDKLGGIGADTNREELWARWSEQGLFDDPISRDEWVSRRNGGYREVRDDG
jgi:hypothetical protein